MVRRIRLSLIVVGLIIFLASAGKIFLWFGLGRYPIRPTTATQPPVTALYLQDYAVHFYCPGSPTCFTNIKLGEQIKSTGYQDDYPPSLKAAFYGSDSMIYLWTERGTWAYLVRIDPQTNHAQFLDLNIPALSDNPGSLPVETIFLPGGVKLIHGKIVVGTPGGRIGILQNDFSLKTISLGSPIRDFIEADNFKIAVLSQNVKLEDGTIRQKIFLIDVFSGEMEETTVNTPENGDGFTLSADMKYYYFTTLDSLHRFDIQSKQDVLSVPISPEEYFVFSTLTSPLNQYKGVWYISRTGIAFEGPSPAMMVNMTSLEPVLNPDEFTKGKRNRQFVVTPYGDYFLIGTNDFIRVVTSFGETVKAYPLPNDWYEREYLFLEYRK